MCENIKICNHPNIFFAKDYGNSNTNFALERLPFFLRCPDCNYNSKDCHSPEEAIISYNNLRLLLPINS